MTTPVPPEDRVAALTPEQRAALTGGDGMWHGRGVPEAGIGRLKVSDGPVGVRGERMTGTSSTSFPCGSALGATWDRELLGRVGRALGEEARGKGVHLLLGPTVNLHRHPLAGRNFECYSEDPTLTAELAVAYVDGVQGTGVGACIKHFVANEQETERMTISAEVPERVLRELQLTPFEAAVKRCRVAAVMSAYNKVGGTWCGEHRWLLTDVLRAEWGFDGFVVSDWFGTHSAEALTAGLDLEMPGRPRYLGKRLLAAVDEGRVAMADVDRAAARLLAARDRLGVTDAPEPVESSADDPAHRALAREAAARSIVLLSNPTGLLPLDASALARLAVIGPNADSPAFQGGGSARVNPHRTVTFLEGLVEHLGDAVEVVHEIGCTAYDGTTVVDSRWLQPGPDAPPNRPHGLSLEFVLPDAPDAVVHREVAARASTLWFHPPATGLGLDGWRCHGTSTFTPPRTGSWELGLTSVGPAQLVLDGEVLVDTSDAEAGGSFYGMGGHERTASVALEAGTAHRLELRYEVASGRGVAGFAVTAKAPVAADAFERAVAAAAEADVAIVVVGSTTEWETEGEDRSTMELPGRQAELVSAVAAANPRTVVVLNAGAPVTTDWAADAGAVALAWLPGQEAGGALADVLFGAADPSGRLPTSFPVRVEDNLAHAGFPGADGHLPYDEGLLLGYRHHDTDGVAPAFCFGHGLSYTSFAYGPPQVVAGRQGRPAIRVTITNTGNRPGREVVQVYAEPSSRPPGAPVRELVGFESVAIAPGEAVTVDLALASRAWTHWSEQDADWAVDPGPVTLHVASSSRTLHGSTRLDPATCPPRFEARSEVGR